MMDGNIWVVLAVVFCFVSWTCNFFLFVYVRRIRKEWREERKMLEKISAANDVVVQEMKDVLIRMKQFMETFEIVEEDDEEPRGRGEGEDS